jgi:hypothetical protein
MGDRNRNRNTPGGRWLYVHTVCTANAGPNSRRELRNSGARSGVAAIQQSLDAQLNRTNLQARRSGTDAIDLSS